MSLSEMIKENAKLSNQWQDNTNNEKALSIQLLTSTIQTNSNQEN
uniref:Uncharacterized protein n=1 Tax=Tetranychus urticae TaxID=32264 RepID=T1KDT7_TETUR